MSVSAREFVDIPPRLRGWLHAGAAPLALAAGIVLVALSPDAQTRIGSVVFVAAALLNYAASAAMHLGRWGPRISPYVRQLDHASIFVLIAGSYTPVIVLMLSGSRQVALLALVWAGAALGVGFRLAWGSAPRWVYTGIYLLLGWAAVAFALDFATFTPVAVPLLLAVGGLLYTAGGVIYGLRRPNPSLRWFGFHEIFHALAIAAFAAQYAGLLVAIRTM